MTYQNKLEKIRAKFSEWQIDALLITAPTNRRWLTGFTGSFGYAVVTADSLILATDGRYWARVEEEHPHVTLYRYKREDGGLRQFLTDLDQNRIGIEAEDVSLAFYNKLRKVQGIDWKLLATTLEPFRDVKTAGEIALIRKAAQIADLAMEQVPEFVTPGMTEKAVAWELEKIMREAGADALAFDIIVASGSNGSRPHHSPSDKPLAIGDAITIDLGAKLDGYHSDLTRTFYLGSTPDEQFNKVFNAVKKAEEAAIAQIKVGMTGKEADQIARDVLTSEGLGDYFLHSLGHGVGLEIHEGPSLRKQNDKPLPANSIITVEPGAYIDGWSGVRIEDLILLTESGAEVISKAHKNPIIPV